MNIKAHHEECTPDKPCQMCVVRNAERTIDDFFATAGRDAVKGYFSRSAAEMVEDDMISRNPLE